MKRYLGRFVLVGTIGCGGTSSMVPDAPAEAGAAADETTDAGAATAPDSSATSDGTCNALEQRGVRFSLRATQAPAPEAMGGTIPDGIWVAISAKLWGSTYSEGRVVGTASATTMEIRRGECHIVMSGADPADQTRSSGTVSTSGATIRLKRTCAHPAGAAAGADLSVGRYTAEPTRLHLFHDSDGVTNEIVYELKEE